MPLNADIDTLITTAKAFAPANTTTDAVTGLVRPLTEVEAITLSGVRLVKRYAAQGSLNERDVLAALINRCNTRLHAIDAAQDTAKATVAAANAAAVATAAAAIVLPE